MPYFAVAVVVGVVIAVHELGHLLAAKACGIPVERFSIGFGPKVWSFERGGTSYWLAAFPLGGYVLPKLEEAGLRELSLTRQIAFALGGPIANLAGAYACLLALGLGASELGAGVVELVRAVGALFAGAGELSGVVGIVAVGGARFGSTLEGLLAFSVLIHLNLAILNMLPLPPLDGGRIVFATLTKLHRPLARLQTPVMLAGWAFMLAVMIYATILDVGKLGAGSL